MVWRVLASHLHPGLLRVATRPGRSERPILLRSRCAVDPADGEGHRRAGAGRPLAERTTGRGRLRPGTVAVPGTRRLPGDRSPPLFPHLALEQGRVERRGALQPLLSAYISAHDSHGDDCPSGSCAYSLPAAAVGGLLYSFLPFHYQRWENHYFLAAYWLIPLAFLPILAICQGCLPFYCRTANGRYERRLPTWQSLGHSVLAVAIASAGAYYAFFACALTAFAGLYAWAVFRTWRSSGRGRRLHCDHRHGGDRSSRPNDSVPVAIRPQPDYRPASRGGRYLRDETRSSHLADPRSQPQHACEPPGALSRPKPTVRGRERRFARHRWRQPACSGWWSSRCSPITGVGPMVLLRALALFAVLLATIGGFGSVFNLLVTGQIRAYNRMGVFIAFLCLIAALWPLDRFLLTRRSPHAVRVRYATWAAVMLIGFLDQTPYAWFKSGIIRTIGGQASRFHADARFFAEIEQIMPAGTKVFCLPVCAVSRTQAHREYADLRAGSRLYPHQHAGLELWRSEGA